MTETLEPDSSEFLVTLLGLAAAISLWILFIQQVPHRPNAIGAGILTFLFATFIAFGTHEIAHYVAAVILGLPGVEYETSPPILRANLVFALLGLTGLLAETILDIQIPMLVAGGLFVGSMYLIRVPMSAGSVVTGEASPWVAVAGPSAGAILGGLFYVFELTTGMWTTITAMTLLVALMNSIPVGGRDGDMVFSSGRLGPSLVLIGTGILSIYLLLNLPL